MTFAQAVQALTQLVYTTSDKGAYFLHSRYKNTQYEEIALREYIYVKAYLAFFLCVHIVGNTTPQQQKEARELARAVLNNIKSTFDRMPASMNYGCNKNELDNRLLHYSDPKTNHDFDLGTTATDYLLFIGDYLNQGANIFEITEVFKQTLLDMQSTMAHKQSSRTSSGCGCTSAIATLAAAISVLLAL